MTRKTNNKGQGLGKAIQTAKKQQRDHLRAQADKLAEQLGVGLASGGSVLEQTCLDDLIATVELRKEVWAEDTGEAEYVQAGPTLLTIDSKGRAAAEHAASERRELISIPRRPKWREGMAVEELAATEAEAFMDWRRGLAQAAQDEGLYLTPYERNLDFWRQLWRCVERSDLLVQIVDGRDPDFYHCRDLIRYIHEVDSKKRHLVLVNKADFLSDEQRALWAEHFRSRGVDAVFFSALRELRRQQKEQLQPQTRRVAADDDEAPAGAGGAAEDEASASAGRGIWSRAAEVEDDDEEEESDSEAAKAAEGPSVVRDAAEVPVPGLQDSDDDLAEEEDGKQEEGDEDEEEEDEEEDEEDEAEDEEHLLGPHAEDELPGVMDAARLLEELCARLSAQGDGEDVGASEAPRRRGTVGFVGYPNVGKSTVINALVGKTKVGMSRTPGKTKHIQTLELSDFGITLCDCPGLVFPSVAATKAHLVINNTVHIDDLRECFSPISLIVEKVGWEKVLARYDCAHAVQDARNRSGDHVLDDTHAFLAAFAVSRNHFLRVGVPDENWAARKVLKDYVTGALLHCELPPSAAAAASAGSASGPSGEATKDEKLDRDSGEELGEGEDEEDDDDDFGDLQSFLKEVKSSGGGRRERNMTKRRARQLNKQMIRGKGPTVESSDCVGVGMAACHRQKGR